MGLGDGSKPETFSKPTATHAFSSESDFQVRVKVTDATYREAMSEPTEISIGHPSGPHVVATTAGVGDSARDIKLEGHYAYVTTTKLDKGTSWFEVFDVQNPLSPQHLGELQIGVPSSQIAIAGTLAYAYLDSIGDIDVIDISNPASPMLASQLVLYISNEARIAAVGHYLFVGRIYPARIDVFDTANPAAPVQSTSINLDPSGSSVVQSLVVSKNICYASVSMGYIRSMHPCGS